MDRRSHEHRFLALLTAGSFLAMMLTWTFTCLDALAGSPWCALESTLGFACGLSFVSLLRTGDPHDRYAD